MADLPSIPRRLTTTDFVPSTVSPSEVAAPGRILAQALGVGADALAEKAREHEKAASTGFFAAESTAARNAAQQMAIDAEGDPDLFDRAWKDFSRDRLSKADKRWQPQLDAALREIGGTQYRGLVSDRYERATKGAKAAILAERDELRKQMSSEAYAGRSGTPEFRVLAERYDTLGNEMAGNPAFGEEREVLDWEGKQLEADLLVEHMRGEVERRFSDSPEDARRYIDETLDNPDLALSAEERRDARKQALSVFSGRAAERQALLADFRSRADDYLDLALKTNQPIDRATGNALIREGMALRDYTKVRRVRLALSERAAVEAYTEAGRTGGRQAQLGLWRDATAGAGASIVDRIIGVESGGRANAANPNSSARGAGQFIDATWLRFVGRYRPDLAEGKSRAEILALRNDPALSREMTGRYAEENAAYLASHGIPASAGNVYLAHFLGPGGAVKMLSADPAMSAAAVNPDAAGSNRSVFYRKDGTARTVGEVLAWADEKMGAGVDPTIIRSLQSEMKGDLKGMVGEMEETIPKFGLDVEQAGIMVDFALAVDDPALTRKVEELIAAGAVLEQAKGASPRQWQEIMDALKSPDMIGDDYLRAKVIGWAGDARQRSMQTLKDDPYAWGVDAGLYPAGPSVDWTDGEALVDTLQRRQANVLTLIADNPAVGPVSALRPGEVQELQQVWANADPNGRVSIAQVLSSTLQPETLRATLRDVAGQDGTNAVAVAATLMGDNREAATGVIRGQAALAANPRFAPKPDDDYVETIDELMPVDVVVPSMENARQGLLEAARYRYADLSNQAGDTSGELDEERMRRAVTEITGGLLEYNGHKVIAPDYAMTQEQFQRVMAGLSDADLAGAVTGGGIPLTAADIAEDGWIMGNSVRLRGVGDGRYLIQFGDGPFASYAIRAGTSELYELDLRYRRP